MLTREDESAWTSLARLTQLRHLDLSATNVTTVDVVSIAALCKFLSVFICNGCNVQPGVLLGLQLCPLTVLELGGMQFR